MTRGDWSGHAGSPPAIDFREIFRYAPDAVFVLSRDGIVLQVNEQAQRLLGYEEHELVGRPVSDFVAPDQLRASLERVRRLARGETVEPARRVFVRRDGTRVPGEIYVTIVPRSADGRDTVVSVVRDVTRALTGERARAEQSVRLEALGTLTSGVAHDLNNILASIIGFTELAREQLQPDSEPARDLERALGAADQARKLASQILTFGRPHDSRPVTVDLEQAIVQIIRLARATLPAGVDLQFESDHSPGTVRGQPARLQQIVLNLCANAGKALAEHGGTVHIRLRTVRLADGAVSGLPPGEYVSLSVIDNGPGIPPDVAPFIFEPFFSTRAGAGGSGLGLSVVKEIVDDHGGAIRLEAADSGAHFHILLPASHGEEVVQADETSAGIVRGHGTVLVLDDEAHFVEIASRVLTTAGYSVMASTDPADALQLVRTWAEEIDLIITDYAMPLMEGPEFLRRVRALGCAVPGLIVSGAAPALDDDERRRLGLAAVLRKPISAGALTFEVAAVLDAGGTDGAHRGD